MAKRRITVPQSKQKQLIAECSGVCSVPDCDVTADLRIHHIDGDPSNNDVANMVVFCPNHHAAADGGEIQAADCHEYKRRCSHLRKVMPSLLQAFEQLIEDRFTGITRQNTPNAGYTCQWIEEGPRIEGHNTIISATEANALLTRFVECIPEFIEQERERRGDDCEDVAGAAHVLAVFRACNETYLSTPEEQELQNLESELSRKFDLFFRFSHDLWFEAMTSKSDGESKNGV